MSYLRMSFESTGIGAMLLVSYVAGITSPVGDYAEHAATSLADVAHMSQFDAAIRSTSPEWLRDGMQLFAFEHNDFNWSRGTIPWGIKTYSTKVDRKVVENVFRDAFAQYRAVIPKEFEKRARYPQDGIRIAFRTEWYGPTIQGNEPTAIELTTDSPRVDLFGVGILINDNKNWTDENGADYHNLKFAALHTIGHALGLGDSDKADAVMAESQGGYKRKDTPFLKQDDIDGVKALYGARKN